MRQDNRNHVLTGFLWQYRWTAGMFLLYTGIFAAIFSLYDLETEAVWYAAGLCILLTVLVLGPYFFVYRKRHCVRKEVLQNIQIMLEELPEPKTLVESDYQEMLVELKRIFDEHVTVWQNERRESMDYYTTWVHQIKTPISVMRMTLQGDDTEENRNLLAELFRIEQYVEMVLGYLRLGSAVSDFVFQEYPLDAIIRQAIHKYAPQFVRSRIRLVYESTDIKVLTDEKWLLFILEQLLSNAIKYAPQGKISIAVTQDKVLKIADDGIGISAEDIPRIFEKGFTGYNGRADKKSTGLGLYLCHLAAKKLSYTIRVESEVGVGTEFSIDLNSNKM
ncbi:MAG: HAMP domain-containing histidine kinase [Hespellia sp.]|jgi:signal transduction histidine kinase|nr:HAMP domain-containing histidine kinase [Hespellia sp.]